MTLPMTVLLTEVVKNRVTSLMSNPNCLSRVFLAREGSLNSEVYSLRIHVFLRVCVYLKMSIMT